MINNPSYEYAQEILISAIEPIGTEKISLSECAGRVLACDLIVRENVPAFDRSPYDGYAFRSVDTLTASKENPVTLQITEEIPAGGVPTKEITAKMAAKVLTGAPIPNGADAVIMYEKTSFTAASVTIFSPVKAGSNIVHAGEDIKKGNVLAAAGMIIDPGLGAMLAAQGEKNPVVFRIPRVAVLSTGSELVEADETPLPGKIRNTNRFMIETALKQLGCEPVYLGIAGDSVRDISALISKGVNECDAIIITGGVSAGDYDFTSAAMEDIGTKMLFRGVDIKPGMACAYGIKEGKPICALSGNPASALTNFYAVAMPALKKLLGRYPYLTREVKVILANDFDKKSTKTRLLRGQLDLSDGTARMLFSADQGNAVIRTAIGCDVMAVIPAGSGPVEAGRVLRGFLL